MSYSLPLDQMSTTEKLRVIEEVWDDLCRSPGAVPSPAWHEETLRPREAQIESGMAKFVEWAQAKKDIRDAVQ